MCAACHLPLCAKHATWDEDAFRCQQCAGKGG
jgi:hypothetical protein